MSTLHDTMPCPPPELDELSDEQREEDERDYQAALAADIAPGDPIYCDDDSCTEPATHVVLRNAAPFDDAFCAIHAPQRDAVLIHAREPADVASVRTRLFLGAV